MRDFVERGCTLTERCTLLLSFVVGSTSDTIIGSINKIGSAFYRPILTAFLVGVLSRKATAVSMFAGIISCIAFSNGLLVAVAVTSTINLVRVRIGSIGGPTGFPLFHSMPSARDSPSTTLEGYPWLRA